MDSREILEKFAAELLEGMGVVCDLEVEAVEEGGEETFRVLVSSEEDSSVLIGYHGENLGALQRILSLFCYQSLGKWLKILVDVGGYREEQRGRLESLAESVAERVRFLQDPVTLPPMNSYERRLVHSAVAEIQGVWTESIGEGRGRRVVVRPGERDET